MANEAFIVQAIYSFKGTNNDELCFKKGDKITVTQREEGGWWEGTLGDMTGWFPSNYVKECKDGASPALSPVAQQRAYKAVVLKDLIDSEKAHVSELQGLVTNFLQPLEKSNILSCDEYRQLTGNLLDILDTHQQILRLIEDEDARPSGEQRVGRLFINWAPRMKTVHQAYCSLHPKAVCLLDKYKEELTTYMESLGAASPGVLVLTAGLSKPFRRLDKYSGMLQELERHVEESHPDRGDTQRSVSVYKDIASTCAATRRQKELELQVLTGPVRGWEGQSLSMLGDIIYMGSVAVGPQHSDRYFVLFPTTLLILSVSHRMSAFIYEGKLPLSGINVTRLEDSEQYKNAFEVNGPLIEKRIAVCQSKEEANHWVDLLRKHMPNRITSVISNHKISPSQAEVVPQPPPHMTPLAVGPNIRQTTAMTTAVGGNSRSRSVAYSSIQSSHGTLNNNRGWSASCLRPAPPLRPCLALGTTPTGSPIRTNRKPISYKEDALILDVIEAYCSSVKPRLTANSVDGSAPEKQLSPEDSTYIANMKDQIRDLQCIVTSLNLQLSAEKEARYALQTILKNFILTNSPQEFDKITWPTMETNC